MRFNIKALALSAGLLWGLGLFLMTWWIIAFDGPSTEINMLGQLYRGYVVTPAGSFYGLVWGFFDGLIGGALFGWLYNTLAGVFSTKAS